MIKWFLKQYDLLFGWGLYIAGLIGSVSYMGYSLPGKVWAVIMLVAIGLALCAITNQRWRGQK